MDYCNKEFSKILTQFITYGWFQPFLSICLRHGVVDTFFENWMFLGIDKFPKISYYYQGFFYLSDVT